MSNNKMSLLVMAAGMGSRFGGLKQIEPVGPHGEVILEFSVYDALEAGFDKAVFVIKKAIEHDFREIIGKRIEKMIDVEYAFQELEDIPAPFTVPAERVKPWGTGQAVLCAKELIQEPFAVINADDYYGKEPFVKLHDYLIQEHTLEEGASPICMAGFVLGNTLSDNGGVTRGVCETDAEGNLIGIHETSNIVKTPEGAAVKKDETLVPVDVNSLVSMNMWGLQPEFLDSLERGFTEFLSKQQPGELKGEYLLPIYIDELLKRGEVQVKVLKTDATWFGVTYQEDKASVQAAFKKLTDDGVYPEGLYQ